MKVELPADYLTVLELFHLEGEHLVEACSSHLAQYTVGPDSELWAEGTIFYESIDPMVERGIVATTRLFLSENETIAFSRVANITVQINRANLKRVKAIRSYKKEFQKLKAQSMDSFDRFWNVSHLHRDISDKRHERQYNILHSCQGIPAMAELFLAIESMTHIIRDFDAEIVRPILIAENQLFE